MAYTFVTSVERSSLMRKIRSSETKPEVRLRSILWREGYRFYKNDNRILGVPDIVFPKRKIAIFVDGDFWHGRNWRRKKPRIKANRDYWIAKIERNKRRDRLVTRALRRQGWVVLRFWESDIKDSPVHCLGIITAQYHKGTSK